MFRRVHEQLKSWKNRARRKPLILKGARQVGKTWSVKSFGKELFNETVVIDFEKTPDRCSAFNESLNPRSILQSLEIAERKKIIPGKTLLFLDEVQKCPRALMSLRYFYEELPELHVIAAGSLLDVILDSFPFPVGRVQYLTMYPMTFFEYLTALGNDTAAEIVSSKPGKVPNATHTALLSELKTYCMVGGMPESVKTFIETGSLLESLNVHDELIQSFLDDFRKYEVKVNSRCIEQVFTGVSKNVAGQINYSRLSDDFTQPTLKKALEVLVNAKIVHRIDSVGRLELPLDIQTSSRKFKALMLDIGLWQRASGMPVDNVIREKNLMDIYRGALVEQFVGQELIANNHDPLYYWARNAKSSSAKVDYILLKEGGMYPVEVKSGSTGSLKSLHLALETFPGCPAGIVLSTRAYEELPEQRIRFVPLYYAGSLGATGL